MDRNYITKGKYHLGSHKGGACYLTWELYKDEKGRVCFSMCGERWESSKERRRGQAPDITDGGQCCDRIAAWFPKDKKAARMVKIWKRWHLNAMKAGTPEQEGFIKGAIAGGFKYEYSAACELLKENGLNPHNGYSYGSAWLFEEIPADIIKEIKDWKNPADMTADELRVEFEDWPGQNSGISAAAGDNYRPKE